MRYKKPIPMNDGDFFAWQKLDDGLHFRIKASESEISSIMDGIRRVLELNHYQYASYLHERDIELSQGFLRKDK